MNQQISIILNQIGVFIVLMGIGFGFMKGKLLNSDSLKGISIVLMKLILPITTFFVVYRSGASLSLFLEKWSFFVILIGLYIVLLLIGMFLSKRMKMPNSKAVPFILYFAFSNNNFFGLPLITSLFDSPSSSVSFSQHLVMDNLILWTFGIYLCSRHLNQGNFLSQMKKGINAMTISVVLAFVMISLQIELPILIEEALIGFKSGSSSLAMFYVGCLLANIEFTDMFKEKKLYLLVFVKMILAPLVILAVFSPILGSETALILAILIGLPGKIVVSIMVGNYGHDEQYAAKLVFATTIVALITIPLITWAASLI